MIVCDVSSLYSPTGGGIRTYYNARIEWFSRQQQHRYVLIVPGWRDRVTRRSTGATVVEIRGLSLRRDPAGYRLLLDVPAVRRVLLDVQPDVLETGDPWISGPVGLCSRDRVKGL